jgi:hypothetical protein
MPFKRKSVSQSSLRLIEPESCISAERISSRFSLSLSLPFGWVVVYFVSRQGAGWGLPLWRLDFRGHVQRWHGREMGMGRISVRERFSWECEAFVVEYVL